MLGQRIEIIGTWSSLIDDHELPLGLRKQAVSSGLDLSGSREMISASGPFALRATDGGANPNFTPAVSVQPIEKREVYSACRAPSFEIESWEERLNERQPPIAIMDAIGVTPSMIIGEEALEKLKRRCEREKITNIEVILGELEDPRLPKSTLDLVFMINVYHHADDAVERVRNAIPSLKASGFLAIVECDPRKTDWGEEHHCTPRETMLRQQKEAGYEPLGVEDFLNEDALYLARSGAGETTRDRPPAERANPGGQALDGRSRI